jgi:hypothetical protein
VEESSIDSCWPSTSSRNWLEPELFFCTVSRLPEGPLPRSFTFTHPEKIRELARRGEAWGTSEARQTLDIQAGREAQNRLKADAKTRNCLVFQGIRNDPAGFTITRVPA